MSNSMIANTLKTLETTGKTFSVKFLKKDGSLREMTCRFGVKKHLKGGEKTYNGKNNNLNNIGVFESLRNSDGTFKQGAYKCFNLDRVVSLKVDGKIIEGDV